jgi:hypothetical protein
VNDTGRWPICVGRPQLRETHRPRCAHMTNPYMASAVKRAYGFCPVYFGFLDLFKIERDDALTMWIAVACGLRVRFSLSVTSCRAA